MKICNFQILLIFAVFFDDFVFDVSSNPRFNSLWSVICHKNISWDPPAHREVNFPKTINPTAGPIYFRIFAGGTRDIAETNFPKISFPPSGGELLVPRVPQNNFLAGEQARFLTPWASQLSKNLLPGVPGTSGKQISQ